MVDSDSRELLGRFPTFDTLKTKDGILGEGVGPSPLNAKGALGHAKKPAAPAPPPKPIPKTTVDISSADSDKLVRFCQFQMANNPGGIGNECTHMVYAGLFEILAVDGTIDLAGVVSTQTLANMTWGREVLNASDVRAGDIVQFANYSQAAFVFRKDAVGTSDETVGQIRGPDHTGIVMKAPSAANPGGFYMFEGHLHRGPDPLPVMQIRIGHVLTEAFGLSLPMTNTDPATKPIYDFLMKGLPRPIDRRQAFFYRYYFGRKSFGIAAQEQIKLEGLIKAGNEPADLGGFVKVTTSGTMKFFRPQVSDARRKMNPVELAAEKQKLIKELQTTGRAGSKLSDPNNAQSPADQFDGDEKKSRIASGRFDWKFTDSPMAPPTPPAADP